MSIAEMAYQETLTEEGKRSTEHERALAAAERAVKDAAMNWWRAYEATDHYKNPWHVLADEGLREAFGTACAALAALEAK